MKIGFTGTRKGMTFEQKKQLVKYLLTVSKHDKEFHHGDCIGADAEAHRIAVQCGFSIYKHPPEDDSYRAYCFLGDEYEPKEYLARNKDIVNTTDVLIATPKSNKEEIRSGTWSTVRYAEKNNKEVIIISPDGSSDSFVRMN